MIKIGDIYEEMFINQIAEKYPFKRIKTTYDYKDHMKVIISNARNMCFPTREYTPTKIVNKADRIKMYISKKAMRQMNLSNYNYLRKRYNIVIVDFYNNDIVCLMFDENFIMIRKGVTTLSNFYNSCLIERW